jgi:predicted Zn-dependent protease with MMP-like domain
MTGMQLNTPSEETIERLAREALARLPAEFLPYLTDIVIRVEEFATQEQLASVSLSDPRRLVGLYRGHPVSKQSVWASGDLPPTIYLFRQPLLARWHQTGATLEAVVNHLVVHEVGHHFGLSDDEMHALEGD